MENNRKEQKEALEVLTEFNGRLVKNMNIIVKELSAQRLEDTDEFLTAIVQAINWEIEVVNGTITLLNEKEERINKEEFNSKIVTLGDAIAEKDDAKIADAIKCLLPIMEELGEAAKEISGQ